MADASSEPLYDVLADPVRRRAYLHVRSLHRAASREEVATALGISHNLAAFHLDKLLDAGLLSAHYARPQGRGGRGAGRPAKWYAPTGREVRVSIPPRRYDLAGELLARAVAETGAGAGVAARAAEIARATGREWGTAHRSRGPRRPGATRTLASAADLLADAGYEPLVDEGEIVLWNCPFHAVAQVAREVVCRFNAELVAGLLEGLGADGLTAVLDPVEGRCCVVVRPS